MKTLKDIEKEIVAEFEAKFPFMKFGAGRVGVEDTDKAEIADFLHAALHRVAEETKKSLKPTDNQLKNKTCREAMEQNFKTFTEGV